MGSTCWCAAVGLEYESLTGVRMILQPQQLQHLTQQQQQQQQQASSEVSFAAAAAAAAGRDSGPEGRQRRTGRHQQQQQQRQVPPISPSGKHASSQATPAAAAAAAASAAAVGSSFARLQGPALPALQADIPLYLTPEQLQLPTGTAGKADGAAAGSTGSTGSSSATVPPLTLMQLQRIHIKTPPAPYAFACQPKVAFTWQGHRHPAAEATAAAGGGTAEPLNVADLGARLVDQGLGSGGGGPSSSSSSNSSSPAVLFSCDEPQVLPADCLMVLHLPKVYTAPRDWVLSFTHAAAALADPAAAVPLSAEMDTGPAAGSSNTDTPEAVAAAAESCLTGSSSGRTVAGAFAGGVAGAAGGASALLPLTPVKPGGVAQQQQDGTKEAWSAVLQAGSWLYPTKQQSAPA